MKCITDFFVIII